MDTLSWSKMPTPISGNDPWRARTVPLNVESTAAQPPAEVIAQSLPENIATVSTESEVPYTNREYSSTEVTYGQEDDESVFVRTAYKGGDLFTVGSSFTRNKQLDDFETPTDEDRGYWHMKMSSAAGSPGPGIEAEFAQSSFDPDTSEGFGVSENRLIKLSTNSAWQGFSVGVGY